MKHTFTILLFILICIANTSYAQSSFDSTLTHYGNDFQQERIYMQFDKGRYNPGETIWCKAYVMAGVIPSFLSKNFYIDW